MREINRNKHKILVADDQPFNICAITGLMTALGMQNVADVVDTCFDGQSLVDYVQTAVSEGDPERYSLIFTDCSMPIMDGYEASRQINKIFKS